jgi:hypothetical protein
MSIVVHKHRLEDQQPALILPAGNSVVTSIGTIVTSIGSSLLLIVALYGGFVALSS